ncbi:hypothetical protein BJ165DRAFT_1524182 [Panaeolus papilionaceus]|nr:hypothetical protein BJ165DRAFT_1524182 [Panaeolus papilionaceus]
MTQAFRILIPKEEYDLVLIDTPGFSTSAVDPSPLENLTDAIKDRPGHHLRFNGIIYFEPVGQLDLQTRKRTRYPMGPRLQAASYDLELPKRMRIRNKVKRKDEEEGDVELSLPPDQEDGSVQAQILSTRFFGAAVMVLPR